LSLRATIIFQLNNTQKYLPLSFADSHFNLVSNFVRTFSRNFFFRTSLLSITTFQKFLPWYFCKKYEFCLCLLFLPIDLGVPGMKKQFYSPPSKKGEWKDVRMVVHVPDAWRLRKLNKMSGAVILQLAQVINGSLLHGVWHSAHRYRSWDLMLRCFVLLVNDIWLFYYKSFFVAFLQILWYFLPRIY
jgi:hypothetical protein